MQLCTENINAGLRTHHQSDCGLKWLLNIRNQISRVQKQVLSRFQKLICYKVIEILGVVIRKFWIVTQTHILIETSGYGTR